MQRLVPFFTFLHRRSDFVYGKYLQVDEIAFSDPTENGMEFSRRYTKRNDFLVYNMWTGQSTSDGHLNDTILL